MYAELILASCSSLFQSIEAEVPSSEKDENALSVKKSESEPEFEESLTRGLRRRSTRRNTKKPGAENEDTDEKESSPVSIFAELLMNFDSFQQSILKLNSISCSRKVQDEGHI